MDTIETAVPEKTASVAKEDLTPGVLCWSKLSRYPWWPSLILERKDGRIPPSERRSIQTSATPVLFFGTAEFAWIDATRNLSPWETEKLSRSQKDKSTEFKRALHEAHTYATKATLPPSFALASHDGTRDGHRSVPDEDPPSKRARSASAAPAKHTPPYPLLAGDDLRRSAREQRKLSVQRHLGLAPPWNCPTTTAAVLNPNLELLLRVDSWGGGDAPSLGDVT